MSEINPDSIVARLYAACINMSRQDAAILLGQESPSYLLRWLEVAGEHQFMVAERLAAVTAERDAAIAERDQLRNALRYFLDDPRFLINVGGNPTAVEAMLKEAFEVWDKTK